MGVKLDWDIESEAGKHREHREDIKQRSQRYLAFAKLIGAVAIFLGIVAGIVFLISQRWNQVNDHLVQLLEETVQAEVASLRIGNFDSFMAVQRSATNDWLLVQQSTYDQYQTLKSGVNVTLSGHVVDAVVDGQRGRAQVEEIIDGVPYVQTWFYWRYEDGWHHVPPDYTFWGSQATIENARFVVRYLDVDTLPAQQVAVELDRWLNEACQLMSCDGLPPITVDIVPQAIEMTWVNPETGAWQLVMSSPYIRRARADIPFDTQARIAMATLFANQLVNRTLANAPIAPNTDPDFLKSAILSWMVGRFVQINTQSYLIDSLSNQYGIASVGVLLRALPSASSITVLSSVTGTGSLASANLDWRDFVKWRLELEDSLILQGNEADWQRLYDFRDETVRTTAYSRFSANMAGQERTVLATRIGQAADGTAQLMAEIEVNTGAELARRTIVFNLVNDVWLRAN